MTDGRSQLAARWERRVMRAAHPIAVPLLESARRPVVRIPGLGVLVRDAAVLRSVLMDQQHFSKTGPGSPGDLWTPLLGPKVLLNMEGASHHELRRKLSPLFTPEYVRELTRDSLEEPTKALTARLTAGEPVDVVAEVAQYASAMISSLVGLDARSLDAGLFARVSSITRFVTLARPRLSEAQVRQARPILVDLTDRAREAYRAGDQATVPGRMRALGIDEADALGAVGAFVLTGTETLVSYIPRLVALLIDSGWLPRLAADRSLLEPVIAEGLRVTTPSPVMLRSVAHHTTIGDVVVRPGDRVILGTFLANGAYGGFDPIGNPAAGLKQLWFGAGAHFCLGAPLAMAQIRTTVIALLDAVGPGGAVGHGAAIGHGDNAAPLAIVRRRASTKVLIPSYRELVVQRS